jgi:signal-transduction protein with cAMP-binding, CBS, and nucleotidyltransferase domain
MGRGQSVVWGAGNDGAAFRLEQRAFNRLSPEGVQTVRDALDIAYFRPGETIIARDGAPESLFFSTFCPS